MWHLICKPPSHAFWAWARVIEQKTKWMPELLLWMAERSQSWNFREESPLKRLKKSRNFALSNSPFTRQHNISLNGTKSKIFDRVSRKCFTNNLITYGYKHARLVSAMQILQAKLNDSDLKFKIYYKYGNATSKEPYLNAFWSYFEARWKTRLRNPRYIVRKCMIWARMWIFRWSLGHFSFLSQVGHGWS